MTIAVTGARGQVGREAAFLLQRKKIPNRLLVRDPKQAAFLQHESSRLAAFDFTNPKTFEQALKGVDSLFFVCDSSIGKQAIRGFLSAAKQAGIKKIIVMSGIGADKGETHFLVNLEALVEELHIPYAVLRANWFFQNFGSHFKEMITHKHALTFPDGKASISFVDARDIAEVAFQLLIGPLEVSGEGFDITGPESLTHASVAELFSKHLPYRVDYKEISEHEAKEKFGWDEVWLSLFRDIRNGITSPVSPSVEKILGKKARRLEDYIKENISIWQ